MIKTRCRWASVQMALFALLALLMGCSAEGTDKDLGSDLLTGELVVYVADLDDGTSEKQYFLRVGGSELDERRLVFATDPELTTGAAIEVRGIARADIFENVGRQQEQLPDEREQSFEYEADDAERN